MRSSYKLPENSTERHSNAPRWFEESARCENRLAEIAKDAELGSYLIEGIRDEAVFILARQADLQLGGAAAALRRAKETASSRDASTGDSFGLLTETENRLIAVAEDAEVAAILLEALWNRLDGAIGTDQFLRLHGALDAAERIQALANYGAESSTNEEGCK